MKVEVLASGEARPPAGAPVTVQVRDARYEDAPATIVGEARSTVTGGEGPVVAVVDVAVESAAAGLTVWAHVDSDGDGRLSRGDFVTVQSYPLPSGAEPRMQVTVKRV